MNRPPVVLWVVGALALFGLLIVGNRACRSDWAAVRERLEADIRAVEKDLAAAEEEQAVLATEIESAVAPLKELKDDFDAKWAREKDPEWKAAWGAHRTGLTLNLLNLRKAAKTLDSTRNLTGSIRAGARTLASVQRVIGQTGRGGTSCCSSSSRP